MERVKIRSKISTLGVHANEEVELDLTPAVLAKIQAGWFVPLVKKDGSRQNLPKRD